MILAGFLAWLPVWLGITAAEAPRSAVTRMSFQDELIVKVPVQPRAAAPALEFIEKKGPKCIPVGEIRRANLSHPGHVDLVLSDRRLLRAEFDEDCPGLDFWGGFYLKPDGETVCAKRDSVYSRVGGSCRIARFRQLVPKLKH